MGKSCLVVLIFILKFQIVYSQISGCYKSNDPEYFTTFLCLKVDVSSFCIVEVMSRQHHGNMYFKGGTYTLKGDSIIFRISKAGFDSDSLKAENYVEKGLLKKKAIMFLNERRECYLKLKRRERFSRAPRCSTC